MAQRLNFPLYVALDSNGDPISGAKLNFYETGTTTPLDTFSDNALSVANANPVVADSGGKFGDIFLKAEDYKVVYTDASDVTISTWDPVGPETVSNFVADLSGGLLATGSSNAYAVTTNQTITALAAGQRIAFIANHTNTAAATLAVDGLTAKSIKKNHDLDLIAGDIEQNQIVDVAYKATEDVWQMLSQDAAVRSTLSKTGAYTIVLADEGNLVRADATSGAFTVTLPLVATAGDGFRTVIKKIDSSANAVTVDGNGAETIDGATTVILVSQYDWVALVCDGTEWHVESKRVTFESSEQTVTADTQINIAHGLGVRPSHWTVYLRNNNTNNGYAAGLEVDIASMNSSGADAGIITFADTTNISVVTGNAIGFISATTKNSVSLTLTDWRWIARAWL